MKRIMVTLSALCCCISLCSCNTGKTVDTSSVKDLDLNRYMGKWYEIARYDHSFEKGLIGCTAEYSIRDDGMVKVINSGYKKSFDGKFKQSVGKARRPDDSAPGRLEVSFFLNFYGDYFVLELADDYRYALIGGSNSKYLWILSRTPVLSGEDLEFLLERAAQRGYDISKLIMVEQR